VPSALRSRFRLWSSASPFDKLRARSRPQIGSSSNLPVPTIQTLAISTWQLALVGKNLIFCAEENIVSDPVFNLRRFLQFRRF
jgi:hypothetical protein